MIITPFSFYNIQHNQSFVNRNIIITVMVGFLTEVRGEQKEKGDF